MAKNTKTQKRKKTIAIPIIVAAIAFLGTIISAIFSSPVIIKLIEKNTNTSTIVVTDTPSIPTSTENTLNVFSHEIWCSSVPYVVPDTITLNTNTSQTTLQELKKLGEQNLLSWAPYLGSDQSAFVVILEATNTTQSTQWLKLSNKVRIKITVLPYDVPDVMDVFIVAGSCGGGEYQQFGNTNLSTNSSEYTLSLTNSQYDYFSLKPGEFENFEFDFKCEAPGYYKAEFLINYSLLDKQYEKNIVNNQLMVCPIKYRVWSTGPSFTTLNFLTELKWNGKNYERE